MREALLILHFIGLAMGMGTSFGFMFLGFKIKKLDPAKRAEFALNIFSLAKMGQIGLALLVISGLGMLHPYFDLLKTNPLLGIKLTLVLILGAMIGILSSWMKKAAAGEAQTYLPKIPKLGRLALVINIIIVILAVLVFQ